VGKSSTTPIFMNVECLSTCAGNVPVFNNTPETVVSLHKHQ
jgi:hypothetical protein